MRLMTKYPLTVVTVALAAALATGVVAFQISKKEMRLAAERQSIEILASRKAALGRYLNSIRQDLAFTVSSKNVRDSLPLFTDAWSLLDGDPEEQLQKLYIHDNPHPTDEKEQFDQASDGSIYSAVHGRYHPWFRQFLKERGYYDIFLFDTDGNLVYTVFKELDYATNLATGRWRSTDLGRAYRTTAFHKTPGFLAFFDFEPYEPSHGAPASFISTPVFDGDKNFIGVLAFQMPIGRINEIMQVSAGMGKSGKAYLVGPDLLVRNDTRFSTASEILKTKKPQEIVTNALQGLSGTAEIVDENGTEMLVTYTSITFGGETWAIIAEIELAEILAPVDEMRRIMIFAGLIIALFVTVIGIWLAGGLSRPIVAMTGIMQRLAERDLEVEVPVSGRTDEIGDMEKALIVFKENAVARQQAETALQENKDLLSAAIESIADGFMLTDSAGCIVLFNRKFRGLYPNSFDLIAEGQTYENFLRSGAERGEYPDAMDRADAWVEEQLSERQKKSGVLEIPLIGGRWSRIASRQLPSGGRVEIHVDVTELKETHVKLATMNDELQDLNELKNKFMGMAAHDLRNPLSAIRGMTQLILELELGEEKEKEFISSIKDVSNQMLDLINDLLDVSAIESGKFDLKREAGNLGELLQSRIELVAFSADAKGICITTDIADLPAIDFDHARIHQVVDNILTNAVKFSPADSIIDTAVRLRGSMIDVVVQDHGQGIPANEVGKVFMAFEKLSSKPTAGEKSTGLGMAIAKKIVDAHGGEIKVDSVIGQGTTFTFSLPVDAIT